MEEKKCLSYFTQLARVATIQSKLAAKNEGFWGNDSVLRSAELSGPQKYENLIFHEP